MGLRSLFKFKRGFFKDKEIDKTDEIMVEFNLNGFNGDMGNAWFLIKELHRRVLKDDPEWHFFYEGNFSIIRCRNKFASRVEKFFEHSLIDYKYNGTWVDSSYAVRDYIDFFKPLFHLYSTLALKLNEGDLFHVSDRVNHCFFNHQSYVAKSYVKAYGQNFWEAQLMGELAVRRAHYIGRLDYFEEVLEKEKEKNEDKDTQ
jgi:hypothetical protein